MMNSFPTVVTLDDRGRARITPVVWARVYHSPNTATVPVASRVSTINSHISRTARSV